MEHHLLLDVLVTLITALAVVYAIVALVLGLRRRRPDLALVAPLMAALGLRVLAATGVSTTSFAQTLRGGDELGFLAESRVIADSGFGSSRWLDATTTALYDAVFAAQIRALESPELALRITQAGIAVAGLAFLAAAVHDLAGPRAARIAAWLLAVEPTNIFFSSILHKEPLMMLAGGLVVFGGAILWASRRGVGLVPLVAGCLIAAATRPYTSWFLIAAGAAIVLHASLTWWKQGSPRALAGLSLVVMLAALSAPTVWQLTSPGTLQERIQPSQDANATDGSNLALERVDYSSREALVTNLPRRVRDVMLRPYPWQVANVSQRLGAIGGIVVLVLLWFVLREGFRQRRRLMATAAPLVYVTVFLLAAYSISAGNAGTAFRYRTHIVALLIAVAAVLWATRRGTRTRTSPG